MTNKFYQVRDSRNSNLELYRILCMLFIILHHLVVHGLDSSIEAESGINKYVVDILSFGGKIGVNGFVLISGYFMVKSQYSIKKYLKLAGEVWFYSVIALTISILIYGTGGGVANILKAVFPVLLSQYWFVTSFIALMILSPFLNLIIQNLKQDQYKRLLIILLVFCSIIPTFINSELSTSLTWFIFLYFIAAYIRLYKSDLEDNSSFRHIIIAGLGIIILWCSSILINCVGSILDKEYILSYSRHFMSRESLLGLVIAYELFMAFLCRKRMDSPIMNKIAGGAFGVYLIHDNANLRIFLWDNIVKYVAWDHPVCLILYAVFCSMLIYVICTLIDLLRQHTVERAWLKWIDRYGENFCRRIICVVRDILFFLKKKYDQFVLKKDSGDI